MSIVDRARAFGGDAAYQDSLELVRVPAERIAEFIAAEVQLGNTVDFIECLYLHAGGGIEPSMALSRDRADFTSDDEFISFASGAASAALQRAEAKDANAYFEASVTER